MNFCKFLSAVIFIGCGLVNTDAQTCATAPIGLVAAYSGDNNALDARSRSNGTIQNNVTFNPNANSTFVPDALDSFNPNANSSVRVIVVQSDGKILIGGNFTTIGGVTRNNIARLNSDGTLDTTFDPNASGDVRAIVLQSDGKILIGGTFFSLAPNGGATVTRNRIARLNSDGTLDLGFDPNANDAVYSIALQSDGKVILGGIFTILTANGGTPTFRQRIARVNASGTLDTSFDVTANGDVLSLVVQPDDKIILGGVFFSLVPNGGGSVTRNRIARLNSNGTLDAAFNPNVTGPGINSIALQSDGKILIGGNFTSIGGVTRNNIARLNSDGTLDTPFNLSANSEVYPIVVQPNGKILLGGTFTFLSSNGGAFVQRVRIARVNSDATLDTNFVADANNLVFSFAVQSDGRVLVGGDFTTIAPDGGSAVIRNRIARLTITTAAAVSVAGRVTIGKKGLARARVTLTDFNGETRTVQTSSFGYYRFDDLEAGRTYIVSVNHKRYFFAPQIITASEDLTELNFTAEP